MFYYINNGLSNFESCENESGRCVENIEGCQLASTINNEFVRYIVDKVSAMLL